MEILAVIPARGGSKGIPRKNLVPLQGRPLVVHSIEHALASRTITRVVVSTEDEEIASTCRKAGADLPFMRPRELAEDHVLDHPVFEHALETLEEMEGYRPDLVVHLRPTAPCRPEGSIDAAVERLLSDPEADSIRSVSLVNQHPYRMFNLRDDGVLSPFVLEPPEPYLLRRQDLPPVYYYNCVIDVTRPRTILSKRSMTGDRMLAYCMDAEDALDIDTPRDLEITRFLMEKSQ